MIEFQRKQRHITIVGEIVQTQINQLESIRLFAICFVLRSKMSVFRQVASNYRGAQLSV